MDRDIIVAAITELAGAVDRHTAALALVHELIEAGPEQEALRQWAREALLEVTPCSRCGSPAEKGCFCEEDCPHCDSSGNGEDGTACRHCKGIGERGCENDCEDPHDPTPTEDPSDATADDPTS